MANTQYDDIAKSLSAHTTLEVNAMDADRFDFDGLTRTLATTDSRRRVLAAAIAGGLFAALGSRGVRAASDQVQICHRTTSDTHEIVLIEVSANAVPDHVAHGDFRYTDCCLDGDCGAGQTCVDGSCQGTCAGPEEVCETHNDCCAPFCCDFDGTCDNDCGFD